MFASRGKRASRHVAFMGRSAECAFDTSDTGGDAAVWPMATPSRTAAVQVFTSGTTQPHAMNAPPLRFPPALRARAFLRSSASCFAREQKEERQLCSLSRRAKYDLRSNAERVPRFARGNPQASGRPGH